MFPQERDRLGVHGGVSDEGREVDCIPTKRREDQGPSVLEKRVKSSSNEQSFLPASFTSSLPKGPSGQGESWNMTHQTASTDALPRRSCSPRNAHPTHSLPPPPDAVFAARRIGFVRSGRGGWLLESDRSRVGDRRGLRRGWRWIC